MKHYAPGVPIILVGTKLKEIFGRLDFLFATEPYLHDVLLKYYVIYFISFYVYIRINGH